MTLVWEVIFGYEPQSTYNKCKNIDKWIISNYRALPGKETIQSEENLQTPTNQENTSGNDTYDKGLISNLYKELRQPYSKKIARLKNEQRT